MFRTERKRLGLTQVQLANKLGVCPLSIMNWESGKSAPQQRHIDSLLEIGFSKKALRNLYLSELDYE